MNILKAVGSGIAGASALTLTHEVTKKFVPKAPRMDLLGMQALSKFFTKAGQNPPKISQQYWLAMAADLGINTLLYGLAGSRRPWLAGSLMGLGMGVASVTLPQQFGLNDKFNTGRNTYTTLGNVGLYVLGGLVAAAVSTLFKGNASLSGLTTPNWITKISSKLGGQGFLGKLPSITRRNRVPAPGASIVGGSNSDKKYEESSSEHFKSVWPADPNTDFQVS